MIAARSSPGRTTITSCPGASGVVNSDEAIVLPSLDFSAAVYSAPGASAVTVAEPAAMSAGVTGTCRSGVSVPLRVSAISESSSGET